MTNLRGKLIWLVKAVPMWLITEIYKEYDLMKVLFLHQNPCPADDICQSDNCVMILNFNLLSMFYFLVQLFETYGHSMTRYIYHHKHVHNHWEIFLTGLFSIQDVIAKMCIIKKKKKDKTHLWRNFGNTIK